MRSQHQITADAGSSPTPPGRKTAVIVEDGAHVALVLLDRGQPTAVGTRFTHQGRVWVVSGTRHGSRVLVAEPAEASRQ